MPPHQFQPTSTPVVSFVEFDKEWKWDWKWNGSPGSFCKSYKSILIWSCCMSMWNVTWYKWEWEASPISGVKECQHYYFFHQPLQNDILFTQCDVFPKLPIYLFYRSEDTIQFQISGVNVKQLLSVKLIYLFCFQS